jgi:hypothetical protein
MTATYLVGLIKSRSGVGSAGARRSTVYAGAAGLEQAAIR